MTKVMEQSHIEARASPDGIPRAVDVARLKQPAI